MSQPKLPDKPNFTREDVINQILASIAMEELGLSHIINAEGEKLQYLLGTIDGVAGPAEPATVEDLLELNKSVRETLGSMIHIQMLLRGKMESALAASVMQGPTGPTGPIGNVGVILASYDSLEELKREHEKGNQGDAYLVGGELYVWNTGSDEWIKIGNLLGPTGPQGPTGPVGVILGSYNTLEELQTAHQTGNQGDAYLVKGELYVWNVDNVAWELVGDLKGPEGPMGPRGMVGPEGPPGPAGPQGIQGVAGTVGTIKGSYESEQALREDNPDGGERGDFYYIEPDLWVWSDDDNDWINVGQIAGPQGIQGIEGERGEAGPTGPTGPVGTILASFNSLEELKDAYPIGNQGESYLVGGDLYVWDIALEEWKKVGELMGPTGPTGPAGLPGSTAPSCVNIQFYSNRGDLRLQSGTFGGRAKVLAVGAYYVEEINSAGGPINPVLPIMSFKMLSNGIITELHAFLQLTLAQTDPTPSLVYAQLYAAPDFNATQFQPIEESMIEFGQIPIGSPVGRVFTFSRTGLAIPVTHGTQLLLCFYNNSVAFTAGTVGYLSGVARMIEQ